MLWLASRNKRRNALIDFGVYHGGKRIIWGNSEDLDDADHKAEIMASKNQATTSPGDSD